MAKYSSPSNTNKGRSNQTKFADGGRQMVNTHYERLKNGQRKQIGGCNTRDRRVIRCLSSETAIKKDHCHIEDPTKLTEQ